MRIVFFKRPKPKQFDYKPIYYDKEKDQREQRRKELGYTDSDDHLDQFRAQLRRKWHRERDAHKRKISDMRTIIYLVIIGFFVYLIFFTDFVQKLVLFFAR